MIPARITGVNGADRADGSGYKKIADFNNGTSDYGLYFLSGQLRFFPVISGSTTFDADTYVQVVLTRDSATDNVTGYVNGAKSFNLQIHRTMP